MQYNRWLPSPHRHTVDHSYSVDDPLWGAMPALTHNIYLCPPTLPTGFSINSLLTVLNSNIENLYRCYIRNRSSISERMNDEKYGDLTTKRDLVSILQHHSLFLCQPVSFFFYLLRLKRLGLINMDEFSVKTHWMGLKLLTLETEQGPWRTSNTYIYSIFMEQKKTREDFGEDV